jgi:peptidoglycan/xylan/chitin deacetylase (PgdA/CDA1 family)
MRFLSENYNVIFIDNFIEAIVKKNPFLPKTVVITFDDGWEDNYLYAFPILKKYKLPATIFLTTEFIGKTKIFWQERVIFLLKKLIASQNNLRMFSKSIHPYPKELQTLLDNFVKGVNRKKSLLNFIENLNFMDKVKRDLLITSLETCLNYPELPKEDNSFLNWEQIKEMAKFQISFGSHGVNHKILTEVEENDFTEEIELSKHLLEKELKVSVKTFAYPNGNYNEKIISNLKTAGYKLALTVESGFNTKETDLYRLKRINIHEDRFINLKGNFSKELFAAYLAGIL